MNPPTRRDILASMTLTAGAVLAGSAATALAADSADQPAKEKTVPPEFYELRALHMRRGVMPKRLDDYFKDAFIPAARRAGAGPIGAFNVVIGQGNPTLHLLIPHPTIESFATLSDKLADDAEYKKASADFRALPATDAPYASIDIQLLKAFPHFPKLEIPKPEARIFELRVYRSHSKSAGAKKIEMFDTLGEIAIFRQSGLAPVFFAQNLTGIGLHALTYMLTFPDLATREKNWNTFRADPQWKKLSSTPGFTDSEIVADINNQILAPTAYSEI